MIVQGASPPTGGEGRSSPRSAPLPLVWVSGANSLSGGGYRSVSRLDVVKGQWVRGRSRGTTSS